MGRHGLALCRSGPGIARKHIRSLNDRHQHFLIELRRFSKISVIPNNFPSSGWYAAIIYVTNRPGRRRITSCRINLRSVRRRSCLPAFPALGAQIKPSRELSRDRTMAEPDSGEDFSSLMRRHSTVSRPMNFRSHRRPQSQAVWLAPSGSWQSRDCS